MHRWTKRWSLTALLLLALVLTACDDGGLGPGNVQNLPSPQSGDEVEERIEESGLEGQTGLAGQQAQEGETTQEQIESNIATYELGSQQGLVAASWLLERDIEDMNETDLGEIDDLLIERGTGRVQYALVEHGGLLDLAESVLPVPLALLQLREQSELILPVQNQEVWGDFPDLDENWATALTPEQAAEIEAFWQQAGLPVEDAGDLSSAQWLSLSSLLGNNLTAGDAPVGQAQDVLIDLPSGRIKYLVAAAGDDAGARLLPYAALDPAAQGESVALIPDFDPALLADVPAVDSAALGETSLYDPAWDDAHEGYWSENGFTFDGE